MNTETNLHHHFPPLYIHVSETPEIKHGGET